MMHVQLSNHINYYIVESWRTVPLLDLSTINLGDILEANA
jgi:hypothetical protein